MARVRFVGETVAGWSRLHPEWDLSDMQVAHSLIWSGRLIEELLEKSATAGGFRRLGDYEVLMLLRRLEPTLVTPIQVAQQLRTSASGMTGKLDRLERQGLIERNADPDDRRAVKLGMTDSGRALIDEAIATSLSIYQAVLEGFAPSEAESLEALLEKLVTRLDELAVLSQP